MTVEAFYPDFNCACRLCGTSPTVIVANHPQPHTKLCAVCMWGDDSDLNTDTWNDHEANEEPSDEQ